MIIRLEITDDVLSVLPILFLQEEGDDKIVIDRKQVFCVGGMHLLEDIAMALNIYDRAIKGTEDDPEGKAFPEEDTERMLKLHKYIVDNLYYIEMLIHQFATKGGITKGVYKARDNMLIFEKES